MGAAKRALIPLLSLIAAHHASLAQVSTDIIRGRVTDPDAHAVQGVEVRATSYQGRVTKTATTDKSGRFTIIYINGEGDYWLDLRDQENRRRRSDDRRRAAVVGNRRARRCERD
jgi:predicted peptidase